MKTKKKQLRTLMITRDLKTATRVFKALTKLFGKANPDWIFEQTKEEGYYGGRMEPDFHVSVQMPVGKNVETIAHRLSILSTAIAGVYLENGVKVN